MSPAWIWASLLLLATPSPRACPEGKPYVVVAGTSGLGPGTVRGVVAAVWADGRLVRARNPKDTSSEYVQARVTERQLKALAELVEDADVWQYPQQPRGFDLPEDWLAVCDGERRRVWKETAPAMEAAPTARIRHFLLELEGREPSTTPEPPVPEWIDWFRADDASPETKTTPRKQRVP